MSDFSAFNLENFDLYKWINETIETKRPNEDFDTFLSSVSMKLQLLSQDCSDHNEEQMKLIMERLPSVVCIELWYNQHSIPHCSFWISCFYDYPSRSKKFLYMPHSWTLSSRIWNNWARRLLEPKRMIAFNTFLNWDTFRPICLFVRSSSIPWVSGISTWRTSRLLLPIMRLKYSVFSIAFTQ